MTPINQKLVLLIFILAGINSNSLAFSLSTLNEDSLQNVSATYRNLPVGISKVVIDPGHGGNDEGCKVKNIKEKNISLAIAKALGSQLKSHYPTLEVIYTRDGDQFVSLGERISIANHNSADLFISIHCNYVNESYVSGSETYVLGSDASSAELVSKEEGSTMPSEFVNSILFKKLENHSYIKSLDIASKIEDSFASLKGVKSRGVRHGAFRVLQMTSMPAVLIEAGFLSNGNDQKRLTSNKGQRAIAQKIFVACTEYFKEVIQIEEQASRNVVEYYPQEKQPIFNIPDVKREYQAKTLYTIQIAQFKHIPTIGMEKKWKNLDKVEIVQRGDNYLYLSGEYDNLEVAMKKQKELENSGFEGAFIISKSD